MKLYASKYSYKLEEDAQSYLAEKLSKDPVEGNGRFATNVIDEAIQIQALRISASEEVDLSLLNRQDIELAVQNVGRGES